MAAGVVLFEKSTREEIESLCGEALAIVPVGATEQHGPHLPTGTDTLHTSWVTLRAARIAARSIPVVVAPTLPFGSSHHHLPFGGTISLSTTTFYSVLREIVESLAGIGFRRIFVVNGHGGNHEIAALVARDVALTSSSAVAAGSWWTVAWDSLVAQWGESAGRFPGHAGIFETSLVMAIDGSLVRAPFPSRPPLEASDLRGYARTYRLEIPGFWQSIDGVSDDPTRAQASDGDRYLRAATRAVADAFVRVHARAGQALGLPDADNPRRR